MRVVVAGGTGMIGSRLVKNLAENNHEVAVLTRNPTKHERDLPAPVKLIEWDGKTVGSWAETLNGVDAVVNLVGESLAGDHFFPDRWTDEKKRRIRQSRLEPAQALVEAIRQLPEKPDLLLQASGIDYYGPRAEEVVTEEADPGSGYLAQFCVEWESYTAPVEELGTRRVILRTGLVLTTEGGPLPRILPILGLFVPGPFGNGRQWWPWIHMDDEIRAISFLLTLDQASGPFNLTAPSPVTNRVMTKTLSRVTNRPAIPVPGFALRLMVGEVAVVVLTGRRAVPQRLLDLGFGFKYTDLEPALRDLLD